MLKKKDNRIGSDDTKQRAPAFQNRIKIQLVLLKTFSTNAFNDINDEGTYLKPDTTQHNAGLSQFKELPLLSLTAHI